MDLSRMRRFEWNPEQGTIRAEPGVTVGDLCDIALRNKQWLPGLPSIKQATIGGCLSVNAHSAMGWKRGSIGEYVASFDLLLASGELRRNISMRDDEELFYSVIGGLGLLGIIISVTLQPRQIRSDILQTRQRVVNSIYEMVEIFAEEASGKEYSVGWIDGYARRNSLGRGIVISGREVDSGRLPLASGGRQPGVVGIMPWLNMVGERTLLSLLHDVRIKLVNTTYYERAIHHSEQFRYMPLTEFHFHYSLPFHLLSSLKDPKRVHFFQPFVPAAFATDVFSEILECSQNAGLIPFRCMLKQHRADRFMLSYQVKGFSLELGYFITPGKETRFIRLLEQMREPVLRAGGRFYPATDDALDRQSYEQSMSEDTINDFLALKRKYDPGMLFQSDLFRRLFG
jgi:decaprenylphospho-beta-D-ribofuranose 2-oxidase